MRIANLCFSILEILHLFGLLLFFSFSACTQAHILRALTRKFRVAADVDLAAVAAQCPLNFTGADFYALASDALIAAYRRKCAWVDACVRRGGSGSSGGNVTDAAAAESTALTVASSGSASAPAATAATAASTIDAAGQVDSRERSTTTRAFLASLSPAELEGANLEFARAMFMAHPLVL